MGNPDRACSALEGVEKSSHVARPMPVMLFLSFDAYNNQRATWRRMMLLLANFPSSSPSALPLAFYFKVQQTNH